MNTKKISLYNFLKSSDTEQYDLIFQKGEFIDTRNEGGFKFAIYAIDMFFVEIQYDVNRNKIVNKTAFKTGAILDKYSFY